MRILIIEDQKPLADLWRRWLASWAQALGARIDVAGNVKEAIAHLETPPPPAIIISDLGLPDSPDREETLRLMMPIFKRLAPDALVVIATGMTTEALQELAQALGADGFCDKTEIDSQESLLRATHSSIARRIARGDRPLEARMSMLEHLTNILANPKHSAI